MKKLIITAFICAMAGQAGCGAGMQDVTYSVTGDPIKVTVHYVDDSGFSFTKAGQTLPWEKSFQSYRKTSLFFSVKSEADGAFTAQIIVDGAIVREGSGSKAGDTVDLEYSPI